ncbi:MAG: 50S ribosomal protein L32 [Armatimonadetes bacterium]|nr:50S ribosomal protein L32 [Candidatus Hippobium faecium]
MPLPKRRHSNQRTRLRRTHYKLGTITVTECPKCHEACMPHTACPSCGFYRGRQIIKIKSKKNTEE